MKVILNEEITIKIEKSFAKTLMRLLFYSIHWSNVRDDDFIEQLPEYRLYESLRKLVGGRPYWELESDEIQMKLEKTNSIAEEEKIIFGDKFNS